MGLIDSACVVDMNLEGPVGRRCDKQNNSSLNMSIFIAKTYEICYLTYQMDFTDYRS